MSDREEKIIVYVNLDDLKILGNILSEVCHGIPDKSLSIAVRKSIKNLLKLLEKVLYIMQHSKNSSSVIKFSADELVILDYAIDDVLRYMDFDLFTRVGATKEEIIDLQNRFKQLLK